MVINCVSKKKREKKIEILVKLFQQNTWSQSREERNFGYARARFSNFFEGVRRNDEMNKSYKPSKIRVVSLWKCEISSNSISIF